jgi:capsular polysaccharide biosynthesis protein
MELKHLAVMMKKRLWLLIGIVALSTVSTMLYSSYSYQPIYQASTKLIVNKTVELEQFGKEQMDLGAIGVNISLINTYKEIIKTPAIMDKVVQRYPDLQLSTEQLSSMIQVTALNGTQVITLSTLDLKYERAARIVNAVAAVFQTEIPKIMKVDNVTILHAASPKDQPFPVNRKTNQTISISFAVSLIVAMGLIFLLEFMDDTIKTEKDARQVFNVPVLSEIPRLKKPAPSRNKKNSQRQVGEVVNATLER